MTNYKASKSIKGIDLWTLGPDVEVYHQGPSRDAGALPTFIYFALSGEESLTLEPINRPAANFKGKQVRVFSVTLPMHGKGYDAANAMQLWAEEAENGPGFMVEFLEKTLKIIDELLNSGYVDLNRVAIGGLSRGGFIASHIAAREPRIGAVLGYSPMTDITKMEVFQSLKNKDSLNVFNIFSTIPQLIRHPVRFYIGNRDIRVDTQSAFKFIKTLADSAYDHGIRSPSAELTVFPSIGHKGHGTPPEVFDQGIEWIKSIWKLKD